jgi:hypothetical protein
VVDFTRAGRGALPTQPGEQYVPSPGKEDPLTDGGSNVSSQEAFAHSRVTDASLRWDAMAAYARAR